MIKTIVVGLGNPGSQYTNTPHNLGFQVVDALAETLGASFTVEPKFQAEIAGRNDVLLVKPQTFMNNSGIAIQKIASYYKIEPEQIFVVHDEFSIPLGQLKISIGKGSANHNGVKSIFEHLGTENFARFRLGVGKDTPMPLEKYVLSPIAASDSQTVSTLITTAVHALTTALTSGSTQAMNQFN